MAQFRFVMRSGPTVGRTYPLEEGEISIGREPSNMISINDAEVSGKHARLLWREEGFLLEDFGSTNGSFVNGQRLSGSTMLRAGDLIALGENVVLLYEADDDPDATMLSAKAIKNAPPPPAPAPIPVYAGQVPAGPEPVPAARVKMSKKTILIIIAVAVFLCICGVSVFLYFAPRTFWCWLPFIQWGPNVCP
jgi:hypothetical protein